MRNILFVLICCMTLSLFGCSSSDYGDAGAAVRKGSCCGAKKSASSCSKSDCSKSSCSKSGCSKSCASSKCQGKKSCSSHDKKAPLCGSDKCPGKDFCPVCRGDKI